MKGLVCAGGQGTRLEELTRATNKHLLPVGSWPMVYYPLQLLQRGASRGAGGHREGARRQTIDLLGDGRVSRRGSDEPLLALNLTYKVQTEAGESRRSSGRRTTSPQGEKLVVVLGDNIFERSQAARFGRGRRASDGALIFVKEVPDPENFGVVVYDDAGRVTDIVEKAGVVDTRYPRRRRATPSSGSTASRRTSSR